MHLPLLHIQHPQPT